MKKPIESDISEMMRKGPKGMNETPKPPVQSMGKHLVGVEFNPSKSNDVAKVKLAIADMMDYVAAAGKDPRCTSIAITKLEEAAMWAVKAMTKPERK